MVAVRSGALALCLLALWSGAARGAFKNKSNEAGFSGVHPSWGAQLIDIDADGDVDVVNAHHYFDVDIHTNDGTGVFSAIGGIPQIVFDVQDRHGLLWADLDGDGLLDAVCSHGGGGGCGCSDDSNELWRSLGGGSLALVDSAGGMFDPAGRGRAFSAADVDADGDLDLFHGKAPLVASPNSLYRNDGNMTFVDVAAAWGVDEGLGTGGALFADYDDDGDPDLFVGGEEFNRPTILWRNDGAGFVDATTAAFGSLPVVAGADFGDYDDDGDLDLAVCEGKEGVYDVWGTIGTEFWFFANHRFSDDGVDVFSVDDLGGDPVVLLRWQNTFDRFKIFLGPSAVHPTSPIFVLNDTYVGAPTFTPGVDHGMYVWRDVPGGPFQFHVSAPPGTAGNFTGNVYTGGVGSPADSSLEQLVVPAAPPRVFRNDGGTFTEVTGGLGLTTSANPRAVAWVDFDNDGDLDLHLMNKGTVEIGNESDILWRNDGATFSPLTGPTWVPGDTDHLTDGGAWGDLDGDGALDLFVQEGTGPLFFSGEGSSIYYRNEGPVGHWARVILDSTATGGTSVGAAVTCHAGALAVHRRVRADSWRGFQPPLSLHFGLGDETLVDSLVVVWPGGAVQTVGPFPADQAIHFAEGEEPTPVAVPLAAAAFDASVTVVPQPSRGLQEIRFSLPAPGRVAAEIYDVAGRRVRRLDDGTRPAGPVHIRWDGTNDTGRRVPAGVYFLRTEGTRPLVQKLVRVR